MLRTQEKEVEVSVSDRSWQNRRVLTDSMTKMESSLAFDPKLSPTTVKSAAVASTPVGLIEVITGGSAEQIFTPVAV